MRSGTQATLRDVAIVIALAEAFDAILDRGRGPELFLDHLAGLLQRALIHSLVRMMNQDPSDISTRITRVVRVTTVPLVQRDRVRRGFRLRSLLLLLLLVLRYPLIFLYTSSRAGEPGGPLLSKLVVET